MKKYLALLAFGGLTVAGCAPEGAEMEAEAVFETPAAALDALREGYADAMNADDLASLLALYEENAVYMPGTGIRVAGSEAIGQALEGMLAVASDVEIIGEAMEFADGWAIERGHWSLTLAPEGVEPLAQSGYYISVSRQQPDGSLKLAWLAANNDGPPVTPSPPDMAPVAAPDPSLDETLEGLRSAWQEQYNAGNAEAVAALYTEDAVAMFAEQSAVEGSAAIQASVEGMNELAPNVTITGEGIVPIGDWVVGRGTHTMSIMSPEGEKMSVSGFHLVVCRQDADGQWKIHWHIGNNYTPSIG